MKCMFNISFSFKPAAFKPTLREKTINWCLVLCAICSDDIHGNLRGPTGTPNIERILAVPRPRTSSEVNHRIGRLPKMYQVNHETPCNPRLR
jgi:hypothetical protein